MSQPKKFKEAENGKKNDKKKKTLSEIFAAVPIMKRLSTGSKGSNELLSKVTGEKNYSLAIREIFDFLGTYR
jgi:hypothetical protein